MTEPAPPVLGDEVPAAFEDPGYRAAVVDLLGAIAYGEISAFERLAEDAKLAPTLPDKPTKADIEAYAKAIAQQQKDLNALLCSVVSVVSHASGIHIHECIDEGRSIDRLGVGLLPTD